MFFFSEVQLSATFDGRKAKLFAVVFVFVANFNILQNFEWVDFGAVVAFCELYNAVNTSNIPDINSIKRFLTI